MLGEGKGREHYSKTPKRVLILLIIPTYLYSYSSRACSMPDTLFGVGNMMNKKYMWTFVLWGTQFEGECR